MIPGCLPGDFLFAMEEFPYILTNQANMLTTSKKRKLLRNVRRYYTSQKRHKLYRMHFWIRCIKIHGFGVVYQVRTRRVYKS